MRADSAAVICMSAVESDNEKIRQGPKKDVPFRLTPVDKGHQKANHRLQRVQLVSYCWVLDPS